MKSFENLRQAALQNTALRRAWARYRGRDQERRFYRWAEKYGKLVEEKKLLYTPQQAEADIRRQVAGRGLRQKKAGEFHSAILTLTGNWGIGMVYELERLGEVSVFDWQKRGYHDDSNFQNRVPELNREIFQFVKESHERKPLDWILITCNGMRILRDTVRRIREELGIPTVHQWLDCKQTFEAGLGPHGQDLGQVDVASEFDAVWTSSRSVCEWYMAVGARPLYMPEGFSPRLTPKCDVEKVADIGFLGISYGLRPDYIESLRRAGLRVNVAGEGWPGNRKVPLELMGQFFGESKLTVGLGGIGYSMQLTCLKGRDFEVPGAGGAYLTTYNPDLAEFFRIGEEILCYSSREEMVELAIRLVRDDAFREQMAARAYARSMREHQWIHRFERVLRALGIMATEPESVAAGIAVGGDASH